MTSSSLEETTTRNYLLMSKMKKEADRKYCPCIAKRKKMITGSLKAALSMYGQNKTKIITGSLKAIIG